MNSAVGRGAWSSEGLAPCIHGCEWSVSVPGRLIPVERVPGTCWIGGVVDRVMGVTPWKEEDCCLRLEPNCCRADRSLVPIPTSEELCYKKARSVRRLVGTDVLSYDAGARASSMGESIMRSAFIQVLPGRHLSTSRARD